VQGVDDGEGSYEYLVYQSVLVDIAKQFDLHPVLDYGEELDEILKSSEARSDGRSLFRQFDPKIPGLHPSLQLASKMNCAFVFRKGAPMEALRAAALARLAAHRGQGPAHAAEDSKRRDASCGEAARVRDPAPARADVSQQKCAVAGRGVKRGLDEADEEEHFGDVVGEGAAKAAKVNNGSTLYKRSSRFKRAV
jgi:hypothetical protein